MGAPVDSNNGFIILNVYPTYWARYLGIVAYSGVISHPIIGGVAGVIATKTIGIAGWNELYSKNPTGILPDQTLRINTESMKNQYICHQMVPIAMAKTSWNLDQRRPDIGLTKTIITKCNP
ncbi:MAG: hypothetical protein RL344_1484 [Pseudomonadota bacterium]